MAAILGVGDYSVQMDAGFITNSFTLGDPVKGVLGNTQFVLGGTIEYFDVTTYVTSVSISRGRQKYRDPIDAGRATITIDDRDGDFSIVNSASPYWNPDRNRLGFEPGKRVRIIREGETLYDGVIVTYDQTITLENRSYVTVGASDDLRRFESITLAGHTPTAQRSDERLDAILNRPEVNLFVGSGQRVLDVGVANLGAQPVEQGVKIGEYFDRITTSEQGRIFIDRQGRFNGQRRIGRALLGSPIAFADLGDPGIEFRSFEVVFE